MENYCFNLSYSGYAICLALSNQCIGIDAENTKNIHHNIINKYFSESS